MNENYKSSKAPIVPITLEGSRIIRYPLKTNVFVFQGPGKYCAMDLRCAVFYSFDCSILVVFAKFQFQMFLKFKISETVNCA